MSEDVRSGIDATEPELGDSGPIQEYRPDEEFRPSEWESAFLSIALFGGLILFGIGCFVFGWN